jgi:hypothetical protein
VTLVKNIVDGSEDISRDAQAERDNPSTFKVALLTRTSEILTGIWLLVIISMFLTAHWSWRSQVHARCIEALKNLSVADAVRMSLCKE